MSIEKQFEANLAKLEELVKRLKFINKELKCLI